MRPISSGSSAPWSREDARWYRRAGSRSCFPRRASSWSPRSPGSSSPSAAACGSPSKVRSRARSFSAWRPRATRGWRSAPRPVATSGSRPSPSFWCRWAFGAPESAFCSRAIRWGSAPPSAPTTSICSLPLQPALRLPLQPRGRSPRIVCVTASPPPNASVDAGRESFTTRRSRDSGRCGCCSRRGCAEARPRCSRARRGRRPRSSTRRFRTSGR